MLNAVLLILSVALLAGLATALELRYRRQASRPSPPPLNVLTSPLDAGKEAGLMSTHRG